MKFLQSTKTGSVWIAQDGNGDASIARGDAVEISREKYAETMARRSDHFSIGSSEDTPRSVTFKTSQRNWKLFVARLEKEGVDRRDCYGAVAKLFNEYALGARLVMKGEQSKHASNAYLEGKKDD
jgi:hypothetical protein